MHGPRPPGAPTPVSRRTHLRGPAASGRPGAIRSAWRVVGVVAIVSAVAVVAAPAANAQAVGLGIADSFAVLAGSGITNTGTTTITGDIGTFPTITESGFGSIVHTGTNHAGDSVTQGAKNSLVTAYDDAAGRLPNNPIAVELGGITLQPGVYTSGTFGNTGVLTLDGLNNPNSVFVFKSAATVIAEANSSVVLINGALACNVTWQVTSSATFRTGSHFVGDVLALTSITAETGATFEGRLLARNGAVTMDTNTITRPECAISQEGEGSAQTTTTAPAATTPPPTTARPPTTTTSGPGTPSAPTLPPTGAPTATLLGGGLALTAMGGATLLADRRRRARTGP